MAQIAGPTISGSASNADDSVKYPKHTPDIYSACQLVKNLQGLSPTIAPQRDCAVAEPLRYFEQ